ncbi:hypothetical protein GCM10011390_44030 [Aureimonas endophytica]|uniref:CENP-V/GFA domain-containing protein n=1 Tax=Aureimonas endophytica TaxID=2027858 RepID=A0A917EAW1_9HYPH|nr:GFA family protein [Aureimonas endophytica]GGE19966.1 hypothetical protein GCM10011390_44030 [Aureimonas endophytica]
MDDRDLVLTGGCLCGAVRYRAHGAPLFAGHCYCADCRKASGSAFVPFMGFLATAVEFFGETQQFRSPSFRGGDAVRNTCPTCGSLVYGGEVGKDDSHTIYAGTLDDPTLFQPSVAIFAKDCPSWSPIPATLTAFPTMPDQETPSEG